MKSISFDRASEYYDRTRALPPDMMERLLALLRTETAGRSCLEIGVGTGRIALPLHASGVRMMGLDLSEPMLVKLIANAGGRPPFPLIRADAAHIPLADSSTDMVLACHVLHLIPEWPQVLREVKRVVRPGGELLTCLGGWPNDLWGEIEQRFVAEAGIDRPRPGPNSIDEVTDLMTGLGARPRSLAPISGTTWFDVDELLARIEEGLYSFTWAVSDSERRRAASATRAWAERRFGAGARLEARALMEWFAFDLP